MRDNQDQIAAVLNRIGVEPKLIDAAMRVDAVIQHWRRRLAKRELGHRAIGALNLPIDLAQLDVLFAIAAPLNEFGETNDSETMVATVAERLFIDPSRASRIVSEMVSAGYARRAVSQADARRTIVELTDAGRTVVDAVQSYKLLLLSEYFSGWSAEDIATFVPLFERYSEWFSNVADIEARYTDEIAALSASVDTALEKADPSGRRSG